MAIIDKNATVEEALVFNNVFVKSLLVEQNVSQTNSLLGVFNVKIVYAKFALKVDDTVVLGKEYKTIYIENYTKEALDKAATGDLDMINALGAIQKAVANIIADRSGMLLLVE